MVSPLPFTAFTFNAFVSPTFIEVVTAFLVTFVAPTLTVNLTVFFVVLTVTVVLPAFLPLIVTFLPDFLAVTIFLFLTVTFLTFAPALKVIVFPTPTVLVVAASAVIGAEFESKSRGKNGANPVNIRVYKSGVNVEVREEVETRGVKIANKGGE